MSESEAGHTLAEAAIAMAIVLAVMVPLAGMLLPLLSAPRHVERLAGLSIAEREMEYTLAGRRYMSDTYDAPEGKWVVSRHILRSEACVWIEVTARRIGASGTTVRLITMRRDEREL